MDEAYAQETRTRKKLLQVEFLSMQSNALLNRELMVKAATETALVRMQMEVSEQTTGDGSYSSSAGASRSGPQPNF